MHSYRLNIFSLTFLAIYIGCGLPDIFEDDPSEKQVKADDLIFVETNGLGESVWQQLSIDLTGKASLTDINTGAQLVIQLPSQRVQNLIAVFQTNRFENYEGRYTDTLQTDNTISEISFTYNGATKTVITDHDSAPEGLQDIVTEIVKIIATIKLKAPELQLEVKKIATPSHGYEFRLNVCNRSQHELILKFDSGKLFDFTVSRATLRQTSAPVLWNWSETLFFPSDASELKLLPGTSTTYTVNWNGRDHRGVLVGDDVVVSARLHSIPGGSTARQNLLLATR